MSTQKERERPDHEIKIPLSEENYQLIKAWQSDEGLRNRGLGRELAAAIERLQEGGCNE